MGSQVTGAMVPASLHMQGLDVVVIMGVWGLVVEADGGVGGSGVAYGSRFIAYAGVGCSGDNGSVGAGGGVGGSGGE